MERSMGPAPATTQNANDPPQVNPDLTVQRLPIVFEGDERRVVTLPFVPGGRTRVESLFDRIGLMPETEVETTLASVKRDFEQRHGDLIGTFDEHYRMAAALLGWSGPWSRPRCLLAGAFLTMEYAIDSAALFNPSIVPHPDQAGADDDELRFILSLRATGEGHVSSIVFRTGTVHRDHTITVDPPPPFLHRARVSPDRRYLKPVFARKLREMAAAKGTAECVLHALPDSFTLAQLNDTVEQTKATWEKLPGSQPAIDTMLWLARSNYHIVRAANAQIAETVIFPLSVEEEHGIEDLRLVRFVEDDGTAVYYGTYTAYNGVRTLPMLISTPDFHRIEVHSLNGACAKNKGMALFPRRIGGHYVMCSRIDGENLYIMYSDHVHFWESATKLAVPRLPWELMQIGNCGSPLETPEGWLLLTHGVGPMRAYSIGAMLLDRDDPTRVLGQLREPLLTPLGEEREGYVPNVVYTCGALIHNGQLFLPYALADRSSKVAVVNLDQMLNRLLDSSSTV